MTKKQQKRLFMMKAVQGVNNASKTTWQDMLPFKKANEELDNIIASIEQAAILQQKTTTGITEDKEEWADKAIRSVLHITKNGYAYAIETKNYDLAAALDKSKSYLLSLPDNEQSAALKAMLLAVEPYAVQLKDYMITPAMITAAKDTLLQSDEAMVKPRTTIVSHSTATDSARTLLNLARPVLQRMDRMIHNFEETEPTYVSNYKKARIIID
ncbi:MAG: hypothetical protein WBP45_10200 [Daejeonella sp.]